MAELPSGTVTMLFSDIEGSTQLLSRLGAAYADALSEQRAVLRSAWKTWDGREMGTEGDSFFVVFEVARNAVCAALAAQRSLRDTLWPGGAPIRVRMGLHTGEPTRHEDGYVGMDVHRAARVAAVANGGQVVLTDATAGVVRDQLPGDIRLVDLGRHRLRDLSTPEHLFQVTSFGMDEDFAPLRSLGTATSLPKPPTPLIGREQELAELLDLVGSQHIRVVTLTGPGGSGKSRLAIAVAEALAATYVDGVYFVPLASSTAADSMWARIADTLGLGENRSRAGVLSEVEHRRLLLLLDNLEQLTDASHVVAEIVRSGPAVSVLATSRRPLHLQAEHEYAVPPLRLPLDSSAAAAGGAAAVQLFCQRAGRVRTGFRLTDANAKEIVAICRRLDGLPLAIELTAARSKLLSPAAMLSRLGTTLDAGSAGVDVPERQRSLRATIAWSNDLLSPSLQIFFRRLGVFPVSADLDAVAAVTGSGGNVLDELDALVDASLARVIEGPDGEPRVTMLQTVRDFALDALAASGELEDIQRRYAEYYVELAEAMGPLLMTGQQFEAVDRLELEHDHFRAALRWSLRPDEPTPPPQSDAMIGVRMCAALWWFWSSQGHSLTEEVWARRAADIAPSVDSSAKARVLLGLGIDAIYHGAGQEGLEPGSLVDTAGRAESTPWELDEAMAIYKRLGDRAGMSETACTLAQWFQATDVARAHELYEQAVGWARGQEHAAATASALHHFADLVWWEGDFERAEAMVRESRDLVARMGNERDVVGRTRDLAVMTMDAGDVAGGLSELLALLPDVRRVRQPTLTLSVVGDIALACSALGDTERAARLFGARDQHALAFGWRSWIERAYVLEQLNRLRSALGEEVCDALMAEGRTLTLDEALEEAERATPPMD